ncbi:transportin-3 isoform X1 [Drosophila elegans]|uniref:transportin-3 isoform X1 n=2 Tax=Drosophila elegans TaxID=30023 RepID=UPI0007E7E09F|nr:transportin-3 isoform X1 [Drosophila elegans]
MESNFTKESVINALYLLRIGTNPPADKYLHSFQKSKEVWRIAEELLSHQPSYPLHILTFAAMSLAKKTKNDFRRLSMPKRWYLRDRFTKHLLNAAMMPESNSLIVQLGICLSALGLGSPNLEEEMCVFVQQLSEQPEHIMALLEVLRILPEEAMSFDPEQHVESLESVRLALRSQSSNIFNTVEGFLERRDLPDGVLLKCLAVLASWTRYGFILTDRVLERKLFHRAYVILVIPLIEGHLEAADCVLGMLEYSLVANYLDSRLFQMVISLEAAFQSSVGKQDLMQNYCHIFVNLFETHYQLTKWDPAKIQERLLTIELLLLIAAKCPLTVVESSMNVWSLLSADLKNHPDDQLISTYRPYFLRFLNQLFIIAAVPASYACIELPSSLDRFRGLVAEVLVDVAHSVEDNTLNELYDIVRNKKSPWTDVEMAIFFLRHLMQRVHQLPFIFNIVDSVRNRKEPLIRLQVLELISTPGIEDPGTIWNCLLNELRQEVPILAAIECRLSLLMPYWKCLLHLASSVDEFHLKESQRSELLARIYTLVRQLGPSYVLEANKYLVNECSNCQGPRKNRINMIQYHLNLSTNI